MDSKSIVMLIRLNVFFKKLMSSPPLLLLLPQIKELEAPRVPWMGFLKRENTVRPPWFDFKVKIQICCILKKVTFVLFFIPEKNIRWQIQTHKKILFYPHIILYISVAKPKLQIHLTHIHLTSSLMWNFVKVVYWNICVEECWKSI